MSITLPPLPEPVNKHGFNCIQTLDQLRARDLEVARAVLEAAANVCAQRENAVEEMHGKQQPGTEAFWMTAGVTSASKRNAANIRALEFTHG